MKKEMSFKEFSEKFLAGKFKNEDIQTQISAGWYDWFCKSSELAKKTKRLGKKAIFLMASPKIDTDKTYVWFKNNCPAVGSLYDDFRISDKETGEVLYTIVPSRKGVSEVYGRENDFEEPLVVGKWKDVKKFFEV